MEMTEHIFEGARFGDRYKTRGGAEAILIGIVPNQLAKLAVDGMPDPMVCYMNGKHIYGIDAFDIVEKIAGGKYPQKNDGASPDNVPEDFNIAESDAATDASELFEKFFINFSERFNFPQDEASRHKSDFMGSLLSAFEKRRRPFPCCEKLLGRKFGPELLKERHVSLALDELSKIEELLACLYNSGEVGAK